MPVARVMGRYCVYILVELPQCLSPESWVGIVCIYSRHQKKLPVLQNGTDGFVVENGKRTDTKRIAHGYRKERPVPFCFPFRSVYFLFVRSIPFTTCAQSFALFLDL